MHRSNIRDQITVNDTCIWRFANWHHPPPRNNPVPPSHPPRQVKTLWPGVHLSPLNVTWLTYNLTTVKRHFDFNLSFLRPVLVIYSLLMCGQWSDIAQTWRNCWGHFCDGQLVTAKIFMGCYICNNFTLAETDWILCTWRHSKCTKYLWKIKKELLT